MIYADCVPPKGSTLIKQTAECQGIASHRLINRKIIMIWQTIYC